MGKKEDYSRREEQSELRPQVGKSLMSACKMNRQVRVAACPEQEEWCPKLNGPLGGRY